MKLYKEQPFKYIKNFIKKGDVKKVALGTICISLSLLTMLSGCSKNNNEPVETEQIIISTTVPNYENIDEVTIPVETTDKIEETDNIETKSTPDLLLENDNFGNSIGINHEEFKISDTLLQKINNQINSYYNKSAFYVVTLDGNLSFGYNINEQFHAASTVKAPYVLYCLKEIEKGNGTLEETMSYELKHKEGKSGLIQYSPFGTEYSLKDIIYYTIHESDNAAFYMLHDRFPKEGYNEMLNELDCSVMKLSNGLKFGMITPKEMLTIWNEIYKYSNESELGANYLEILKNAKYNFIKDGLKSELGEDCEIAHKSGFNSKGRHDVAIVFDDIPYFITIMTDYPGENSNNSHIMAMAKLLNEVMEEYKIYLKDIKTSNMQK